MKKILLATVSIFTSIAAMAQLPVSTTSENKNVVLEEFTGIHCTFCPDGHLRAANIKAANPNDFFIINIHEGSFASPSAGEPDFRTAFGNAIGQLANSASVGWPSGSINRHVFSGSAIAHSRGDWATNTATVIAQPSYANLAVEADIDVATRVMTVDLEAYFTAAGASSVNINVAITQDNIEGPQTGSAGNPANVLPNGNYNHGHVFRHFVTGQWGDVVTTTSMGTTVSRQYTWTIPTDINGVPVEIGDLNIVAYIAEGQTEVITANDGPISFTVPPGTILVDLETNSQTPAPTDYCTSSITPKVYITNNETSSCSGYKISYSLDGGSPVVETVTTPLAGGASVSHTFPAATLSSGSHTLGFDIELTSATEIEIVTGNNTSSSPNFLTIPASTIAAPIVEGFESVNIGEIPTSLNIDNPDGVRMYVVSQAISSTVNWELGGFGNSTNSLRFDYYAITTGAPAVFFDKIDFSVLADAQLTFVHAHAQYDGTEADQLQIMISTDCGSTWTVVWDKSGTALATVAPVSSGRYYPQITDWVNDTVNLNAYAGEAEVLVKVVGTSGYGNSLYVDDLNITGAPLGITELFESSDISIYPNPATTTAALELTVTETQNVNIRIYDLSGRSVQLFNRTLTSGSNVINLDTKGLTNGVYFVEVSSDAKTTTRRLVIQK